MLFGRIALTIAILGYGLFGIWLLIDPDKMDTWIGVRAMSDEARTEVRAFYGGIEIGLAIFLTVCALRRDLVRIGCGCLFAVSGCVAVCRTAGMFIDDTASTKMLVFLSVDGGLGLLGALAFAVLSRARTQSSA